MTCSVDFDGVFSIHKFEDVLLRKSSERRLVIIMIGHGSLNSFGFPKETFFESDFEWLSQEVASRFIETVVFVESCRSASIFENIDIPMRVLCVASSGSEELTFGLFCPDGAKCLSQALTENDCVSGTHIGSCLGDPLPLGLLGLLSVSQVTETLGSMLFGLTKNLTSKMRVFGDKRILNRSIEDFFGWNRFSGFSFLGRT